MIDLNLSPKEAFERLDEFTLLDMAYFWEAREPGRIFLRQPYGNTWTEYSYGEAVRKARVIAAALQQLNLPERSHVALLSRNCADWIITDLGILMAGHISIPFYANLNDTALNEVLEHSESRLMFVGKILEDDWENMKNGIPSDLPCVTLPDYPRPGMKSMEDFTKGCDPLSNAYVPDIEDLCTIIYTSGTTGTPKGVMHSYKTMAGAVNAAKYPVGIDIPNPRFLSYLPLSHTAERGILEFGCMYSGGTISFVEDFDSFAANLNAAKVTHFFAVPRIWEKMQQKVQEKLPQKKLNLLLKIPFVSSLVKKKIREGMGLTNAVHMLSGAAPISVSLLNWYDSIGIPIQEGYGMTENFNACTVNPISDRRAGFVGKFYQNMEYKIVPETGELIMKAPWVFLGYYKAQELTDQTIIDGWLHTGDVGEVDKDGYLKITGRVKEIFKTSKGKYIAPSPMEMQFISEQEIDQACIMGVGFPQPFILITLSEFGNKEPKGDITSKLTNLLDKINSHLLDYQRINHIVVVPEEWSTENGLLTPTLKLKRKSIQEYYEPHLATWYERSEKVIWG